MNMLDTFKLIAVIAIVTVVSSACAVIGGKKYVVNLHMSSLVENHGGTINHGCLINAKRSENEFEQHIRMEQGEFSTEQFGVAYVAYNSDTGNVEIEITCKAEHPYMLESTSKANNAFNRVLLSITLTPTARFESSESRVQQLSDWVRGGFSIVLSDRKTEDKFQYSSESTVKLFSNGELWGKANASYEIAGLTSAAGYPLCTGYLSFDFETIALLIPPQEPDSLKNYLHIDSSWINLTPDKIYMREWELTAEVETSTC